MILVSFDSTLTPMFSQGLPVGTPSKLAGGYIKVEFPGLFCFSAY